MPHLGPALDQPIPLSKLLQVGLELSPDEAALLSRKGDASWSELEAVSNGLAANYLALGLKPGDRFASLMPNRIALFAHYLACFKAGLVLTPLNYRYTPPEIDHALAVSGASVILAHAERAADLAATKAGKLPLGIIAFGPKGTSGSDFESLATAGSGGELPHMLPDARAAIFFTSGSTGPAKGVTHTVGSLGWMSQAQSSRLSSAPTTWRCRRHPARISAVSPSRSRRSRRAHPSPWRGPSIMTSLGRCSGRPGRR